MLGSLVLAGDGAVRVLVARAGDRDRLCRHPARPQHVRHRLWCAGDDLRWVYWRALAWSCLGCGADARPARSCTATRAPDCGRWPSRSSWSVPRSVSSRRSSDGPRRRTGRSTAATSPNAARRSSSSHWASRSSCPARRCPACSGRHIRTARGTSRSSVAFLGSVALWWVYFDRAAADSALVIDSSDDPGRLGRNAFHWVHPLIIAGIIVSAAADEVVLACTERARRDDHVVAGRRRRRAVPRRACGVQGGRVATRLVAAGDRGGRPAAAARAGPARVRTDAVDRRLSSSSSQSRWRIGCSIRPRSLTRRGLASARRPDVEGRRCIDQVEDRGRRLRCGRRRGERGDADQLAALVQVQRLFAGSATGSCAACGRSSPLIAVVCG